MMQHTTTVAALLEPTRTTVLPCGQAITLHRLRAKEFFLQAEARFGFLIESLTVLLGHEPSADDITSMMPSLLMQVFHDEVSGFGATLFVGCFALAEYTEDAALDLHAQLGEWGLADWELFWLSVTEMNASPFAMWQLEFVRAGKPAAVLEEARKLVTRTESPSSDELASIPATEPSSSRTSSRRSKRTSDGNDAETHV